MEPAFQRGDILFLNNWVRAAHFYIRPSSCTYCARDFCRRVLMCISVVARPSLPCVCAGLSGASVQGWGHCRLQTAGRDIPIVHRVLKVHEKDDGDVDLLTKGDNNKVDDRGLYNTGQKWLNKEHVIGRARGYLPYVGMVTIIMNDYPMFKCALAVVALLVSREVAIRLHG